MVLSLIPLHPHQRHHLHHLPVRKQNNCNDSTSVCASQNLSSSRSDGINSQDPHSFHARRNRSHTLPTSNLDSQRTKPTIDSGDDGDQDDKANEDDKVDEDLERNNSEGERDENEKMTVHQMHMRKRLVGVMR